MASRKSEVWRTRADFERDLFASYKQSRLQKDDPILPMGSGVIAYQEKKHKIRLPKKVVTAFSILDDLILDAVLWHHSFAMLIWNVSSDSITTLERALMALHMKVTQDAIAVRNLMKSGFDVQAKNLLRSIDEHVDAIYYLCLRPAAADDFVLTEDDVTANRFWWKHIRGSRKLIDEEIHKIIKSEEAGEFSKFKSAERRLLSMAHHPSYAACTTPFLVPYGSNVTMYMFGLPSEYSYRTAKLLFYILAEAAMCPALLNKDVNLLVSKKGDDKLQAILRCGRVHLGTMLLHLINNWDSPVFDTSTSMKKLLGSLPKD